MKYFTPGPVHRSPSVNGSIRNLHHRSEEFYNLLLSIKSDLHGFLGVDATYNTIAFSSTGTGAMESVISSIVPHARCLILSNGYFGDRLVSVADRFSAHFFVFKCSHYARFDLAHVANVVDHISPDYIFCVHHETRTSLLNDLFGLSLVAKNAGALIVADCTSSVICEDVDPTALDLDLFFYSSAKGLRSLPGLAFVTGKQSVFDRLPSRAASFYFDLKAEYTSQSMHGRTRFAQPSHLYIALRRSLNEMLEEGLVQIQSGIRNNMRLIRQWADSNGIHPLIPYQISAGSCTTFRSDIPFCDLNRRMQKEGFQIFYGESDKAPQFQLSTIGKLSEKDVIRLLRSLDRALVHRCRQIVHG